MPTSAHDANDASRPRAPRSVRVLVTAGPTEEPLDEVRFLGNRSSGRMGIALAEAFAEAFSGASADSGGEVLLALGPVRVAVPAPRPGLVVERFRTAADLEALLRRELPSADLVVMAAAVADFRPRTRSEGKLRRSAEGMTIELEGVPDLLAATSAARRPGSRVVGFALEPRDRLAASARDKLARKDLHAIVANPLETMDSEEIEGVLLLRDGSERSPGGRVPKQVFARWLAATLLAR
jgi:phosphopantothenoylcysteine decarboxylase/phosphopantothenate--cysteine ligase